MVSASLQLKPTSNRLKSFLLSLYYLLEGAILCLIPESWRQKDIYGQTVLITGSGSGIGQQMAVRFAKLGCDLVLWDIDESGLKKTCQLIQDEAKETKVKFYRVDLSKREEIYQTADKMKSQDGVKVDILVNNAGVVSGHYLLDTPDEKIQQTFNVNTLSHYYTLKCFLPEMIAQKRGHVVTVASVGGNIVGTKIGDYCASKFANVAFDYALRLELSQAGLTEYIKTTIVKPYIITTGMFEGAQNYLLPLLTPEYVAERVVRGVRANTEEVILPYYILALFWLFTYLPSKALLWFADFAGARDMMAHFRGRNPNELAKEIASVQNSSITTGNNNNNNEMVELKDKDL